MLPEKEPEDLCQLTQHSHLHPKNAIIELKIIFSIKHKQETNTSEK